MSTNIQPFVDVLPRTFQGKTVCMAVVTVINTNPNSRSRLNNDDSFDFELDAPWGRVLSLSASVVVNSPSRKLEARDFMLAIGANGRSAHVQFVGRPTTLSPGEGFGFALEFKAPAGLAVGILTATSRTSPRVDAIAPLFTSLAFTASHDRDVDSVDVDREGVIVNGGSATINGGKTRISGGNTSVSGGNTSISGGSTNISDGTTTIIGGSTTINGGTVDVGAGTTINAGPGAVINVSGVGPVSGADAPSGPNFLQVATAKWYDAAGLQRVTLPAAPPFSGSALVFDGRSVWAALTNGDTLVRLDRTTGVITEIALGPSTSERFPAVESMVYDGKNFWISGPQGGLVVDAGGQVVMRPLPACGRGAMLFDGTFLWFGSGHSLQRFGAELQTGLLASVTLPSGLDIEGLAFDGADIWIAASDPTGGKLLRVHITDGQTSIPQDLGFRPSAIAFDRRDLWIADPMSNAVRRWKYDTDSGTWALSASYAAGFLPSSLLFDGTNMWVANRGSNNVTKLRVADGIHLGTFAVGTAPDAMAFDGVNIWVTSMADGTVSRL